MEESFRITKHDLKIRPIYHWKPNRVKAHLAISFMAYTLVRYLEHRVRLQYVKLSPEKIRKILLSIQVSVLYDTKTAKNGHTWTPKTVLLGHPKRKHLDSENGFTWTLLA